MFYENRVIYESYMAKQWTKLAQLRRLTAHIGRQELAVRFNNAVLKCDAKLIQECLERGIDPNHHSGNFYTALHMAAENGNEKLIVILLQYVGTDIDFRTTEGATPLLLACKLRNLHCVERLVRYGANVEIPDINGYRPIHYACLLAQVDMVKFLLRHRARVNVLNTFAKSPLMLAAVDNPNLEIVELLIGRGADLDFHTDETLPLFLECAAMCTSALHLPVLKLLLHYGADINERERDFRRTALHISAVTGYKPLAAFLLENGADKHLVDYRGDTAARLARRIENFHMVEFLNQDNNDITLVCNDV